MRKYLVLFLIINIFLISSCTSIKTSDSSVKNESEVEDSLHELSLFNTPLDEALSKMTLEEKIGQLFIVVPEALDPESYFKYSDNFNNFKVRELTSDMLSYIKKYNIGGIILFANNIHTPDQLKKMTAQIAGSSDYGMFICTDEEGGIVARLANTKSFDLPKLSNMQKIGASGNTENAKDVGRTIGKYLGEYGINVDFAPDSDVNTNPKNIVIGQRAFGSNPELVGKMVGACIEGFHEENMITAIKHFPGHGDTTGDTHDGFVNVNKTWEEMVTCEIIPFKAGIAAGTDMIMTAHISAEKATGNKYPSSLSHFMIQEKLREEIGYEGVVITDSMSMGAIKKHYSSEESAVLAIKAGVDIILMPFDFESSYYAVLEAVKNDIISEKRIDESVKRILSLKNKYGIFKYE